MKAYGQDPVACGRAETLIPGYLDGELNETQAGPLRQHLLSCPPCRGRAADLTNVKRWMDAAVPSESFEIPLGFSARVASAAFAESVFELEPEPTIAPARTHSQALGVKDSSILPFVLSLTAVAAALLLSFSFLLGLQGQPTGSDLAAEQLPDMLPEVLRELDEMNAKEKKDLSTLDFEKERGNFRR